MGGNGKSLRLGDVCPKIGSGATPRGGSKVYIDTGIALIRSQNVLNDGFSYDGLAYITDHAARALDNVTVLPRDVLLNITGDSVARACQVPEGTLPARVNQHVAIIRPDPDVLHPEYLRYFLVSPTMQNWMLALATAGGTRNALTKGMIEDFVVPVPETLPEQRAIAQVLGTLDDKIELNRRMNGTLEGMARALFQSWFVDFDPVRAKASGEPPESICQRLALTPDLLALFPDAFQDSELGEIPEGWEVKAAYDIATYINGAAYRAFKPNDDQEGLPIVKIAELKAGITAQTKFSAEEMSEKYLIDNGDILFSWSGNPDTSIDTFVWCHGRAWLNQHIFRVVPRHPRERSFVLSALRHLIPVFAEIARNKQTTGLGHVTVRDMQRLQLVIPRIQIHDAWNRLAGPLIERSHQLEIENLHVANLRDTLLPRLLSGELRVPQAARQVEAVL